MSEALTHNDDKCFCDCASDQANNAMQQNWDASIIISNVFTSSKRYKT